MANNRGVVYAGPGKVEVQSIDFPKLALGSRKCEHGVILKLVGTNICGSDQHMVRGQGRAVFQARRERTLDGEDRCERLRYGGKAKTKRPHQSFLRRQGLVLALPLGFVFHQKMLRQDRLQTTISHSLAP
jgi:hypothetical protein